MMSDASLMYTILPSVLCSACVQKAQTHPCFVHTHISLGFILAPSANTIPLENGTPRVTCRSSRSRSFCDSPLFLNNSPVQYPICLHRQPPCETVVKLILHPSVQCKPEWAYLLRVSEPTLSVSTDSTLAPDVTG